MPFPTCLLPAPDHSNSTIVTTPHINPILLNDLLVQTSSLAQSLDLSDLHLQHLGENLYCIDFEAATTFWYTIKKLACTIILAANPCMERHRIHPFIPRARLLEINMPPPAIISAYSYSQNPVFTSGTPEEIVEKYWHAQSIGLDVIQWICKAKVRCLNTPNQWRWESNPSELFTALTIALPTLPDAPQHNLIKYFGDSSDSSDDKEVNNSLALVKYVPPNNSQFQPSDHTNQQEYWR
jgi:hypothetical protein